MARKWSVVVLTVALALAVVPLAAARGGNGGNCREKLKFELVGTVSAVDAAASSLTVHVKRGNRPVKELRGLDLPLVVDPAARVRIVTAEGCTTATLADVPVGARVKVCGRVDYTDPANPVFIALGVKARIATDAPRKLKFELVGTVSAVDAAASSLTVHVKRGNRPVKELRGLDLPLVVDSAARVRIVTAEGCTTATLADVPVGARVKVCGRVDYTDPANPVFIALGVKACIASSPPPSPVLGR